MDGSDLRAAVELVRGFDAAVEASRSFGAFPEPTIKAREVYKAESLLARAYLADNPADDGDPITLEFLSAAGGQRFAFFGSWRFEAGDRWLQYSPGDDPDDDDDPDERVTYCDGTVDGDIVYLPCDGTRGGFRRLCRALNIPLKETA